MDHLWTPWRSTYVTKKGRGVQCIFCEALVNDNDDENLLLRRAKHNFIILNRFPYSSGHLMIAPNAHASRLNQIDLATSDEMMRLARDAETILEDVYCPHGINIGMNLGEAAGAGIAAHIHLHVLPRWIGDANFMTVVGGTRVMPESLDDTFLKLKDRFRQL